MAIEHTDNTRSLFCLKASRSWWWDDNKSTKAVNYTQRAQLRPWYTMGWRGSLYTACLLYQSVNSRPNTYPPYNNTSPIDIIARFWACGVEFLELQKELSGQKVANISLLSKFEPFFYLVMNGWRLYQSITIDRLRNCVSVLLQSKEWKFGSPSIRSITAKGCH